MFKKSLVLLVLACLLVGCFGGCRQTDAGTTGTTTVPTTGAPVINEVDYAGEVKLNMNSSTRSFPAR